MGKIVKQNPANRIKMSEFFKILKEEDQKFLTQGQGAFDKLCELDSFNKELYDFLNDNQLYEAYSDEEIKPKVIDDFLLEALQKLFSEE